VERINIKSAKTGLEVTDSRHEREKKENFPLYMRFISNL